jgi:hypothetical protein
MVEVLTPLAPSPFTESKDNMATTYDKIATTTLGSANVSITFSSISSAYTDLKLIFVPTSVSSQASPRLRFNSDTGTNYSYTRIRGSGTAADSTRGTSTDTIIIAAGTGVSTTTPAFYEVDLFSYAGSTNKTILSASSNDYNGAGETGRVVGLWRSTAAISTILITIDGTTTFSTGTSATLYGILKA